MSQSGILEFEGAFPSLGEGAFIAPGAIVIGAATLRAGASVWYNSVVRADVCPIHIGARTNIQDLSVIHVTSGRFETFIGDDVTVGHRVILHGCTIANNCLIGMGSIVLDGAHIEENCLIGAGSTVTPGTRIPAGHLAIGSPARVKRALSDEEIASFGISAAHYVQLALRHKR
ncbi:MAG: gamma carbonic anhydrase family protein [Bradymonadaceae bacterium]|nr:gamma carbonic anhydrase family protein [Lujinxingiaceae bacterium]